MSAEPVSPVGLVFVLLCSDLGEHGIDPHALASRINQSRSGAKAEVFEHLCREPSLAESRLATIAPDSLVVGFCHVRSVGAAIEAAARRAGLSPLAVQALPLGAICGQQPSATDRGGLLLQSAIARARAFPGARPEHLKPSLRKRRGRATRRSLFSFASLTYRPVPRVEPTACMAASGCAQCVPACPADALRWTGGEIELQRDSCTSCGACVLGCPWRAIEMPGWSPVEIEAQIESLLASDDGASIVFVCADAPIPAGEWLPVPVRCVGGLPVAALLAPLAHGAAAVAVAACACRSSRQPDIWPRIEYSRALLAALGLPEERVQLLQVDGDDRLPSPPAFRPLLSSVDGRPLRISGPGAGAAAITRLALLAGRPDLRLEHPSAPTGLVAIDAEVCTACGTCATACPAGALTSVESDRSVAMEFIPARCLACGRCVDVCPERAQGAITMERVTDITALAGSGHVLLRQDVAYCRACGGPVAASGVLKRIAGVLGTQFDPRTMAELCPACRQGI